MASTARRDPLARLDAILVQANRVAIGTMLVGMTVLVFANVVTRYGFGISIAWSEEVSRYLMIWCTFLGGGLALRQGRLIAVEVLQDALPPALRHALRILIGGVVVAFLAFVAWLGFDFAIDNWGRKTPVLRISQGVPYLAVPVGMVVLAMHLVLTFRSFLDRDWEEEAEPADDAEAYLNEGRAASGLGDEAR